MRGIDTIAPPTTGLEDQGPGQESRASGACDPHIDVTRADVLSASYAGLSIARRRALVLSLNAATYVALAFGVFQLLRPAGLDGAESVILAGFLLATPTTVTGFWNSIIGLMLIHAGDPARSVYPFFRARVGDEPEHPAPRTALTVFLRNEDPGPTFAQLDAMRQSLRAARQGAAFDFLVLSDTDIAAIAQDEVARFEAFRQGAHEDEAPPVYRRRDRNVGHKVGNLREFLARQGGVYDYFVPLDADSVMSASLLVGLRDAMRANPAIGILQTLVVGMPAQSGFARAFQFGMRHGMRTFTMGAAWWNGDCGSYWGHNAIVRSQAYLEHCVLASVDGDVPLSHDQLEAVYMRRAGYEVRVLPVETPSFETNPPTIIEFRRRDLRWCRGNMQYWRFIFEKGLKPVSRFQLLQAVMMYVAPAAWIAMTLAAMWKSLTSGFPVGSAELGIALFVGVFVLSIAPKLAGIADVALRRRGADKYGGKLRFALSVVVELSMSMLLAPIVAIYVTVFLAGLPFGRRMHWAGQQRTSKGVSPAAAIRAMAPQTLVGLGLGLALLSVDRLAFFWSLPFLAGLGLSIPFALVTGSPLFGRWTSRLGLFAIPEEAALPRLLSGIVSPASRLWRHDPDAPSAAIPHPSATGRSAIRSRSSDAIPASERCQG